MKIRDDGVDKDKLKKIQGQLKDNKFVPTSNSDKLTNLDVIHKPQNGSKCPCGSKAKYRKCCAPNDLVQSTKFMDEIERYLKDGGKKEISGLIFV